MVKYGYMNTKKLQHWLLMDEHSNMHRLPHPFSMNKNNQNEWIPVVPFISFFHSLIQSF
jgi:hypothetical protein